MISMMKVLEKMGHIHRGYDDGTYHSWLVFR